MGTWGKGNRGSAAPFLCKSLVSAQPLVTAPLGAVKPRLGTVLAPSCQHGQVSLCRPNATTRIEQSVTVSVLRLEICPPESFQVLFVLQRSQPRSGGLEAKGSAAR